MGYIYLITNKVNDKKYVGQTICKDINTRWKQYKKLDKHSIGRSLYNALIKYHLDNFKFQIVCICFDEDCNKLEKEYIKKFDTLSPNGYNLMEGGDNSKHHPETIELIRASLKGRITCPKTPEINLKKSISMRGDKNHNFGKKMSEDQKNKIRDKLKGNRKNYIVSKKQLEGLAKGRINNPNKKRIGKFDNEDKILEEFNSISEASKQTNISRQTISKVCNNIMPYKTAGGFIWKFI
jgi:group I intron endonuclease